MSLPPYDVEDPVFGQRYRFSREGDVLTVDLEVAAGKGVPDHLHPHLEERWQVLEGEVTFRAGGAARVPGPGEEVVVPAGVRHSFTNTGAGPALLRAEAEPALLLQEFLTESAQLNRAGKVTKRGIPTSLGAALEAADFVDRYFETTVLFLPPPFPPPAIQRVVLPPLARLHRRRRARS